MASWTWSIPTIVILRSALLRRDLRSKRLGHDLSISHDERIGGELDAAVGRLGLPHDVGRIAVDLLPQHLEVQPWRHEFPEDSGEEVADRLAATHQSIRGEDSRLGGIVGHDAG